MQWGGQEYVEEAIKEGFEVISFSDHSHLYLKMDMSQESRQMPFKTLRKKNVRRYHSFPHWKWEIFFRDF